MSKPKQEGLAQQNLINQGYEVYRPLLEVEKLKRGKKVKVEESLFPRYLFIQLCNQTQDWSPIRSTLGVSQIVRFGSRAAQVPNQIIEQLKEHETTCSNKLQSHKNLKQGEPIHVGEGPFYGVPALFQGYDADERVIALINLLGQEHRVSLQASQVEKM